MNAIVSFLVTALVTALSLLIISRLPLGVEIDSTEKAIQAGIVFGILNGIAKAIFIITFPISVLTLGLFALLLNILVFGLTAKLIEGFRLNWGFVSAIMGAFALAIVNSILNSILLRFFPNLIG